MPEPLGMEEDSVGLAGLTELSFEAVQSLSSQWVQGQVFSEQVVQEHGKAALDFLECQWAVQGGTQEEAALDTICPVVGKPERSSVHLRFYLQELGTASIPRRDGAKPRSDRLLCTRWHWSYTISLECRSGQNIFLTVAHSCSRSCSRRVLPLLRRGPWEEWRFDCSTASYLP